MLNPSVVGSRDGKIEESPVVWNDSRRRVQGMLEWSVMDPGMNLGARQ